MLVFLFSFILCVCVSGRSHPGRAQRGVARAQTVDSQSVFSPIAASPVSREKTPKRQASLPIAIRHSAPITGTVPQPHTVTPTSSSRGSPEIEQAEEAIPAPEVYALQSLNASGREAGATSNNNTNNSAATHQQDIPLEDFSQRAHAAISHAREFLNKSDANAKARSSSYSPCRGRSGSPAASPRGRTSLLSRRLSEERSRSTGRLEVRKRAGSFPKEGHQGTEKASSRTGLTSFTVSEKLRSQSDPVESAKVDTKPRSGSDPAEPVSTERPSKKDLKPRKRTKSGPKSLTPALVPAVSLLTAGADQVVSSDSPKLVPPAKPEHIRSISDTSSVDSEQTQPDPSADSVFPQTRRSLLADIAYADEEPPKVPTTTTVEEEVFTKDPKSSPSSQPAEEPAETSSPAPSSQQESAAPSEEGEASMDTQDQTTGQVEETTTAPEATSTEPKTTTESASEATSKEATDVTAAEATDKVDEPTPSASTDTTDGHQGEEPEQPVVNGTNEDITDSSLSQSPSRPPVMIPRTAPTVSESCVTANAELVETSGGDESATEQLTKLAQSPKETFTFFTDNNSLQMSPPKSAMSPDSVEDSDHWPQLET